MEPFSAANAADRSSDGSAWHSDPPIVPQFLTTGSAITRSASCRIEARSLHRGRETLRPPPGSAASESPTAIGSNSWLPMPCSSTSGALAGLDVRNLTRDDASQLNLRPGTEGVVITGVASGSPAEEAGLQPGDVIVQLNHKTVRNIEDYRKISKSIGKNDAALLLVVRQGGRIFVVINP